MFYRYLFFILFGFNFYYLNAHTDSFFPEASEKLDLLPNDFAEMAKDPFWGRGFEELVLMGENTKQLTDPIIENPEWGGNNEKKILNYYDAHQEGIMDRMLGYIAYKLGVMIQGEISQEKLALLLENFDLQKLMDQGPYDHPDLSLAAQNLIFDSLHRTDRVIDIHLHNLGYDEGNYLNLKSAAYGYAEWKDYFTFLVLRYASGMSSPLGSTQEARKRIQLYAAHFPKLCGFVLPIHPAILSNGLIDWENTGNYLTDSSALLTAKSFKSDHSELLPAVSVHPFDPKWEEKLKEAHAKGIRLVKWMPPQSIPPDSDDLDAYYAALKNLNMVLIAHAGPEHAIPTHEGNREWEDYGNPLRFRKPIKAGVKVILAHCGHHDLIPDLDHPDLKLVPGYELFLRLAREAFQQNWSGKLYGDLAAVTTHYGPDFISAILQHSHEEGVRLIYGSDYPYTNLIKPNHDAYDLCSAAGLLDPEKVAPLKEIRSWNPLLANYVFTKNLELVKLTGERIRFPEETFSYHFKDGELKLFDREQWEIFKVSL